MRSGLVRWLLIFVVITIAKRSYADDAVSPTFALGVFFEFGDEKGTAGGIQVWAGGTYYPEIDRDASDSLAFVSLGLQLRTGFMPVLTGPNQISPQLRAGIAIVDAANADNDGLGSRKHPLPLANLYVTAGYRLASELGLDNMDHKRKDEAAFRIGIGATVPWVPAATDAPIPDGGEFLVDINNDGSVDRIGFDMVIGF